MTGEFLSAKLSITAMDQTVSHQATAPASTAAPEYFRPGIEDIVILPLVALALIVAKMLRAIFRFLVSLIDFLFPILLQIMRFPLFTLRILGDGIAALLRGIVRILPVGGTKRQAWREAIKEKWAWLRAKISYKAFEEWLHHIFEDGMAWVFRKCKALTPRTALLVLFGAILWLPISFGVATLMHIVLAAKALVWPAWLQLLHPVATVIAKSKLLVLPVYPAAWPQAKKHPIMQGLLAFFGFVGTMYLVRKTGYRYRETEYAAAEVAQASGLAASAIGINQFFGLLMEGINVTAAAIGRGIRAALLWLVELLAAIPLFGGIVRRYEQHYDEVSQHPKPPVSERVGDFYARWSVKFTAKYYEDKEREEAAATGLAQVQASGAR
jgi:hypothetical protein